MQKALERLRAVAATEENLMDATLDCARAGVTTGEWAGVLREVFGEYRAPTGVSAATGVTADDYWESRSSFWGTFYNPERFPTMTWIWETGGFDRTDEDELGFGLARLLDGIELLVERNARA